MDDFAVLIISHGRAELLKTENTLRSCGYSGRIVYVIDDTDKHLDKYIEIHGHENVYVFNKRYLASCSDRMDNFNILKAALYARNSMWDIAKDLNLKSFLVMDDDYYYFGHRGEYGAKKTRRLDDIFEWFVDYLNTTDIKCIAFSQGGDHIGGWKDNIPIKRKMMNAFFCLTSRPFKFYGTINEDVNAYLNNGRVGDLYFTFMNFQLDQIDTQQTKGGLTETYLLTGTYVKSFYSVMCAPSCCNVRLMGESSIRLHHSINWECAIPCIVNDSYKK